MEHLSTVLSVVVLAASAAGAEVSANDDEAAIRSAITSYVEAFNKRDAKALAAHWGEQGEFILASGETLRGRDQLEDSFAEYFRETGSPKLELADTTVDFLSPHVAVETGIARVVVPDEEPNETQYEAIHVKNDSEWKIDRVREQERPTPPPTHYEQLKALEWMIGQWSDADQSAVIETNVRWTTNQNFIVHTFRVYIEEGVDFEGTQVIGWDSFAQTIRCWTFDSDGGFGVGRWSGADGRWTVQTLNVLADGRRGSATNIYELVDENTLRYRSIGRQIDGQLLPNIGPVTVHRTN